MMSDPSWTVRIHAFNVLAADPSPDFARIVREGLHDSYELVARSSVKMAAALGDTTLVADVRSFREAHPEMVRASGYAADDAVAILTNAGHYGKSVTGAADRSRPVKRRINDIRTFRNARSIYAVDTLLGIVGDASDDSNVRTVACETLGWYRESVCRARIIAALSEALDGAADAGGGAAAGGVPGASVEGGVPENLAKEIKKTIKRLKWE